MTETQNPSGRLAVVFGGGGFLGRYVVRALTKRGWRVRVACRRPDLTGHLQPLGSVGQIQAVQANLRYPASVKAASHRPLNWAVIGAQLAGTTEPLPQ